MMSRFFGGRGGQPSPRKGQELPQIMQAPTLGLELACLMGSYVFIVITCAFYLGTGGYTLPALAVLVVFLVQIRDEEVRNRLYPSTVFFVVVYVVSTTLAFWVGTRIYYTWWYPFWSSHSGRIYHDVPPLAHSSIYADAGIIHFAEDSQLDTSRSFGYVAGTNMYCVAPLYSSTEPIHPHSMGPHITFWAVGMNCCNRQGDFTCDGAGETETRSGFVLRDPSVDEKKMESTRRKYFKAIRAACSLHLMQMGPQDEIMLLRWATHPEDVLYAWRRRAVFFTILACVLYCILFGFGWAWFHYWLDKQVKDEFGKHGQGGGGGSAGA